MPQDAYTLKYLCRELNDIFKNGRINKIIQPDNDTVIFTVYTGVKTEKLCISVNPSCPRISITEKDVASPLTAPNYCMLLRKHLLSATIDNISIVGFDRIVKIDLTSSQEFFDAQKKVLFVELMGRYSNIILTENGKVLGGNRGINFFDNGVRPLIVGKDYIFPPVSQKKEPWDNSLIEYFNNFNGDFNCDFVGYLLNGVQGLAESTAREIVANYLCKNKSFNATVFFNLLNEFVNKKEYAPCVIYKANKATDVCVFAYKEYLDCQCVKYKKLVDAERDFFDKRQSDKKFSEKKEQLKSVINSNVKKVKKKLNLIVARKKDALDCEQNRIFGELILANIYLIKKGDKKIKVLNYYDGTEIEIPLNSDYTASQNSNAYYKKYNKQKRTLEALKPQENQAVDELNYLNNVLDEVLIAENYNDLMCIKDELVSCGIIKSDNLPKNKKIEQVKYREYFINGFKVVVGRNNIENDKITFSANPEDIWLHAKNFHSSHLVISTGKKNVDDKTIVCCAEICAYYSKGREGGKTEIVYTKKKYVKKTPKSKPGACIYTDFSSITVEPNKHTELLKSE